MGHWLRWSFSGCACCADLLWRGLFVAVVGATCLAAVLMRQQHLQDASRAEARLAQTTATLDQEVQDATDFAKHISSDDAVIAAIKSGNGNAAASTLQRAMLEHQLQLITLVDAHGIVLLRAHNPTLAGDQFLDNAPWAIDALRGTPVSGKTYDEQGQTIVAAAAPVYVNTAPAGMIVVGYQIGQTLVTTIRNQFTGGLAIATTSGVQAYSMGSATEQAVYGSAALDNLVRASLAANHETLANETYHLTYNGAPYLINSQVLSTLVEGQPLALLVMEDDVPPPVSPYFAVIVGALLAWLLSQTEWYLVPLRRSLRIIFSSVRNAIRSRLPHHGHR